MRFLKVLRIYNAHDFRKKVKICEKNVTRFLANKEDFATSELFVIRSFLTDAA